MSYCGESSRPPSSRGRRASSSSGSRCGLERATPGGPRWVRALCYGMGCTCAHGFENKQ